MYVREGVISTKEMKCLLKIAVKTELFKGNIPDQTNKRFFPRNSTIRNHMAIVRRKLYHSLIDQEQLQFKIDGWIKEHQNTKIYFRPKGVSSVDDSYENSLHDSDSDNENDDEVKLKDTRDIHIVCLSECLAKKTVQTLWK